jgi:DNA-binding Xre family transcriptional regulator
MRKVSYDPLWKKLIDLRMTKTELQDVAGFSKSTLAKMRKNEYVALEVIERICNTLDCDVSDVISVLPAKEVLTAIRRVTDSYAGDEADQDSRWSGLSSRVRSEDIAGGCDERLQICIR